MPGKIGFTPGYKPPKAKAATAAKGKIGFTPGHEPRVKVIAGGSSQQKIGFTPGYEPGGPSAIDKMRVNSGLKGTSSGPSAIDKMRANAGLSGGGKRHGGGILGSIL